MEYKAEQVYLECLKQFTGTDGRAPLGGISLGNYIPGTLSENISGFFLSVIEGDANPELLPEAKTLKKLFNKSSNIFTSFYNKDENADFLNSRADIIFNSTDPLERARAVSELWSPELKINNDSIFENWKLSGVKENPAQYEPTEIIIQLNALYSPTENAVPDDVSKRTSAAYIKYIAGNPDKIAVYDHPVPIFTRGNEHELEKCLVELDSDISFEKTSGVFPINQNLKVLISISTTHAGLDSICEMWLEEVLKEFELENLDCYLLSENKARKLDKMLGKSGNIFTVQGKYACHFGALKYAQLLFEKAYGIKAGFKLDTDEGIHSKDMKEVSGKTWFQQLCHKYWGGTAVNSSGEKITLGFNIGEYVDSRDLDSLGYAEAISTPEVKIKDDLRGPYLLFNKGACQAKGTMLLNRSKKLEDFVSHPLVKGGGYGVDNQTLRNAVPVGFSMVGRAEDQQFYYSAINNGVQGIFNPLLRIIHYKADVAKSENKHKAGTSVADIYRMLLFRELMNFLNVIEKTVPFPANFASPLSTEQAFYLWLFLIFQASAEGDETSAEEYLSEGLSQLFPLLNEIDAGKVTELFEEERKAWKDFISAVDGMDKSSATKWLESLKIN